MPRAMRRCRTSCAVPVHDEPGIGALATLSRPCEERRMDVGITIAPIPGRTAALARMAEELGFAGVRVPDSQNLAPEVWGQLMLAAQATSTIELGSGVTNSLTRD